MKNKVLLPILMFCGALIMCGGVAFADDFLKIYLGETIYLFILFLLILYNAYTILLILTRLLDKESEGKTVS